jgi:urease accessory protein
MKLKPLILATTLAITMTSSAFAHVGVGSHESLAQGMTHPVTGLDHFLAMVTVGFIGARGGKRAMWVLPLVFLAMMALGSMVGFQGATLPQLESGIAASVVVLGILLAFNVRMPIVASAALVGGFAILHGNAHGAEMPAGSIPVLYALGFLGATALLHGIGLIAGMLVNRIAASHVSRLTASHR